MGEENKDRGSIGSGVWMVAVCHLILLVYPVLLLYIGVAQLPYALALYLYYRKRGKTASAQGVLIGASVTFLLNAACQGFVYLLLRGE
ncbi:MAG: hypothetical protein ACXVC1_02800 [Tumebacillaceae bacterium]